MILARFKNSLFGLGMLLAGLVLMHTAQTYPYVGTPGEDPMFFPRLLLWPWLGLSIIICIMDFRENRDILANVDFRPLALVTILLGMAAILLPVAGFIPVSLFFFIFYARLTGYGDWKMLVPVALIFTIAIWWLFNNALELQLPAMPL